jgi:predicted GIY-YIG superfamily endonuclease
LRCGELGPSFRWDDTELEGLQVHKTYFVYLLASRRNGTLYTGVTSDLMGRVAQHREHVVAGFTSKYDVTRLVWFEPHESIEAAIREKSRSRRGSAPGRSSCSGT